MKNLSELSTKIIEQPNKSSTQMQTGSSTDRSHKEEVPILNNNQQDFVFDFGVTVGRVLEAFAQVGLQLGFNLIEQQATHATIIKQRKKRFLDLFNCINLSSQQTYDYTAIKVTIKIDEKSSTRIFRIKGLVGSGAEVRNFLDKFAAKAEEIKKYSGSGFLQEDLEQIADEPSNPFHLQVCADYTFYKMLSMENYGLGRKLSESLDTFKSSFKNAQESTDLIPLPMKNVFNIIGEVVEDLYKEFNSGRKEMQKVMPYCRISVEKYVCEKLADTIVPIYQLKFKAMQDEFMEKREKILNKKTILQIFNETCLTRKYWLVKDEPKQYSNAITVQSLFERRQTIRYYKAVQQLQKIKSTTNIRQKLKHCQMMYTHLKRLVFDFYGGKQELNNMEDILPIIIIVVLLSDAPHLKSQIEIMNDFIGFDPCDQESQKRLLINLNESYNYIRRDWKI